VGIAAGPVNISPRTEPRKAIRILHRRAFGAVRGFAWLSDMVNEKSAKSFKNSEKLLYNGLFPGSVLATGTE
jgi:hypothetical protein